MEYNKNRKSILFYMVKWHQYSDKVDYQYTVSCAFLFQCCLPKIIHICSWFVKVINRNTLSVSQLGYNKNGIFNDIIITSALRSDMAV